MNAEELRAKRRANVAAANAVPLAELQPFITLCEAALEKSLVDNTKDQTAPIALDGLGWKDNYLEALRKHYAGRGIRVDVIMESDLLQANGMTIPSFGLQPRLVLYYGEVDVVSSRFFPPTTPSHWFGRESREARRDRPEKHTVIFVPEGDR